MADTKSPQKIPEIKWEDDDALFEGEKPVEKDEGSQEFEALLETADAPAYFMIGEKVKGIVSSLPSGTGTAVLVDLGGKTTGVIEKQEFADEDGNLKIRVGDPVEGFVLSKRGGEILLSHRMSQQLKSLEDLESAQQRRMSVRGKVLKAVKGGFEVAVLGKTAFCPISQIDTHFTENATEHLGKDYEFLVEKVEEKGRNIVLSRAAFLRSQAEVRTKELLASLKPESVLDGTVTEVRDFGAFVDIGGVEGLVHVSALGHARVAKAGDAVSKGDKVRVKVLKIDKDERGRPKISLSMKATAQDPWESIHDHVQGGKTYAGKVVNLMAFGAFIEVRPGIEGLLHVSEMSWVKRIHHPSDVMKVGDTVTVTVKDVDTVQKRLSLTLKQLEDDPWFEASTRFPAGKVVKAKVDKLKPFGAIVELAGGLTGLLPLAVIKRKFAESYKAHTTPGKELDVRIVTLDKEQRKILLTLADIEEEDADRKNYLDYLESERAAAVAAEKPAEPAAGAAPKAGSFGALLSAKLGQRK